MNKRRYYFYFLAAVCFGIFDSWYESNSHLITLTIIRNFTQSYLFSWLIWLFLLIPVVIIEIKKTNNFKKTVLSGMLTWMTGILSFYLSIYFKLTFIGQESMINFHISHYKDPFFLTNTFHLFIDQILLSVEWLIVAAVGGFIISSLIFLIFKMFNKKNHSLNL